MSTMEKILATVQEDKKIEEVDKVALLEQIDTIGEASDSLKHLLISLLRRKSISYKKSSEILSEAGEHSSATNLSDFVNGYVNRSPVWILRVLKILLEHQEET